MRKRGTDNMQISFIRLMQNNVNHLQMNLPIGIKEDAESLEIVDAAKDGSIDHSVFGQPNGQSIAVQLLRRHQVANAKMNVHLPISGLVGNDACKFIKMFLRYLE